MRSGRLMRYRPVNTDILVNKKIHRQGTFLTGVFFIGDRKAMSGWL